MVLRFAGAEIALDVLEQLGMDTEIILMISSAIFASGRDCGFF